MDKPVLITGCPKSGTQYMYLMLKDKFKMNVGHESDKPEGMVSWRSVHPKEPTDRYKVKLHQVRDPIGSINSMHCLHGQDLSYMEDSGIVSFGEDGPILRAMKIWYYWNLNAELMCHFTYRVEQLDDILPIFCELIGRETDHSEIKKMRKTHNSWKNKKEYGSSTWDSIMNTDEKLGGRIRKLADKYGYA